MVESYPTGISQTSGIGLFRRNLALWRCRDVDRPLDVPADGAIDHLHVSSGPVRYEDLAVWSNPSRTACRVPWSNMSSCCGFRLD